MSPRSVFRYLVLFLGLAGTFPGEIALAQYTYDPANADERFSAGLRYFGSVKDENGALISGASIVIENAQVSFVFVTNEQGRFRGVLPLNLVGVQMSARCSKPGYQTVRVNKRPGPKSSQQPVMQLDCVLKATHPPP